MLGFVLLLVIVLPIAWLVSEWHGSRFTRICFGMAAKNLIQNTIIELEAGRSDDVLAGLIELRDEFRPTYETRDGYNVLVDRYIDRISDSPVRHQDGSPYWSHETEEF